MELSTLKNAVKLFFFSMVMAILTSNWAHGAAPSGYSVREYGAIGDGAALDTASVQKTIDACSAAGGGTVSFPVGVYRCGSLHLRSHVTLWLDNGATLLGSTQKKDYDPRETLPFKNDADEETSFFHQSLIWGEDLEQVSIAGFGTIDSGFKKRGGPKPIALKRCQFVHIRDVHILNAPNYAISLLGTDYVQIDGVTILNAFADGIDPDACKNVRISNCHIESVDDAIVPKSSFSLGERRTCENITVTNCYMATRCNGFKLGTESGGGFKQIAVSNCVISGLIGRSPALSGVAIESVDGGILDGVVVSNITMTDVRAPIFIRLGNRGRDMAEPAPGALRNVTINGINATRASLACSITGIPDHPVENITLSDIRIYFLGGNPRQPSDAPVPEEESRYPESVMFGPLPAYALFFRHVRNITISGLDFSYAPNFWRLTTDVYRDIQWPENADPPSLSEPGDAGHALFVQDVDELDIDNLRAQASHDGTAVIRFSNVRGAQLRGIRAQGSTPVLLEVSGASSSDIQFSPTTLDGVEKPVSLLDGVGPASVRVTN